MTAKIDKISVAVAHLEAACLLVIRENYDVPAHTLISAAKAIIWDLSKDNVNPIVNKLDQVLYSRLETSEKQKIWRKYRNEKANFFKHADKDPDNNLDIQYLKETNDVELLLCIMGLLGRQDGLTPKLTIGLLHCRFSVGDWFNIEEMLEDATNCEEAFIQLHNLTDAERRDIFLELFDSNNARLKT